MSARFPTGKQPEFDHKHCDKKVVYHIVNADAGNAESTVTFSKNSVMGDVVAQLVVRSASRPNGFHDQRLESRPGHKKNL